MSEQEYIDKIKELQVKISLYEQNGAAKAAYSINRKLNEKK